jgi:hypothetical protein
LLDKRAIEVQVERTAKSGGAVLNMVVGAFMALIFLGLPLAIIGLFIASILDRRGGRPPESLASSPEHLASAASYRGDRRRRIIYGKYPAGTAAERNKPTRVHGDQLH